MCDTVLSFEYQRHSQMKVMVDGDQQDFGQKNSFMTIKYYYY